MQAHPDVSCLQIKTDGFCVHVCINTGRPLQLQYRFKFFWHTARENLLLVLTDWNVVSVWAPVQLRWEETPQTCCTVLLRHTMPHLIRCNHFKQQRTQRCYRAGSYQLVRFTIKSPLRSFWMISSMTGTGRKWQSAEVSGLFTSSLWFLETTCQCVCEIDRQWEWATLSVLCEWVWFIASFLFCMNSARGMGFPPIRVSALYVCIVFANTKQHPKISIV